MPLNIPQFGKQCIFDELPLENAIFQFAIFQELYLYRFWQLLSQAITITLEHLPVGMRMFFDLKKP